ncbi:MAG: PAS domain-containing protein [Methanobacterium sp.]|uniref:PAS domain-containing protein n=1 Tax=Methanobacterium sp. TaxID=2164 RepID=UPI003C75B2F6
MKIEEKFREIYQKSPIGIIICNKTGNIIYANPSALKIIQISKLEDITNNNIFVYPDIATKKELLVKEGIIEFQVPSDLIQNNKEISCNSEALINWNISVTDFGFLVQIRDIKEWQKTDKIVQKSEEKFQKFFEDDLTGDFIASPTGKLIMCNPSFVEIYGFEDHEQAMKTEISKFNQEDWINLINMLRTECKIKGHQSWHRRPDGKLIHVVANLVGIFNSTGSLIQVKGYVFDDTDRKKAEEFLQSSEEKYHRLFDEDLTGDFIATIDGEILECNPAFAEIYGFTNRDLASKCNISKFNSFDWPYMITRLKKESRLKGFQSWQRRSDGMRIHIVANLVGIFNELNELIEVKGYVFDDTDRKQAEEELARSKHQMTEILDRIQDGFIALSHYWHFIYSNKCASEYFKVEYDDLMGQNLWETFPELKETIYETSFKKAMETQEIQHFEVKGLHNKDHCFDFTVYPSAEGISVYWRNISQRKKNYKS